MDELGSHSGRRSW